MLDRLRANGYQIEYYAHALAILSQDFPNEMEQLDRVLDATAVPIAEIIAGGGGEADGTQRMRRALTLEEWKKINFKIEKIVNGVPRESISHEIDHVKITPAGTLALEIEWNNKDPFFDRDLENFKRLHAEGAISAGIIITRGAELQAALKPLVLRFALENGIASFDDLVRFGYEPTRRQRDIVNRRVSRGLPFPEAWSSFFVGDKFGASTTHWGKLQDRVRRGVGNPCPLLLIGLPASVIQF